MFSHLTRYLILLGLGAQIGTIVFYSFVLTPALFGHLPREEAGRAVRLGFPGYYLTCSLALALALIAAMASGGPALLSAAISAALGLELYAWTSLLPRLARLRRAMLSLESPDPSDPAYLDWQRLHRLSVQLNLAALLLGLSALWIVAA